MVSFSGVMDLLDVMLLGAVHCSSLDQLSLGLHRQHAIVVVPSDLIQASALLHHVESLELQGRTSLHQSMAPVLQLDVASKELLAQLVLLTRNQAILGFLVLGVVAMVDLHQIVLLQTTRGVFARLVPHSTASTLLRDAFRHV